MKSLIGLTAFGVDFVAVPAAAVVVSLVVLDMMDLDFFEYSSRRWRQVRNRCIGQASFFPLVYLAYVYLCNRSKVLE